MCQRLQGIAWMTILWLMSMAVPEISFCQDSGKSHSGDIVGIEDRILQYHQPFRIQYKQSDSAVLGSKENPVGIDMLIFKNTLDVPDTVSMASREGLWEANFSVPDTSVKMVLLSFRIQYSESIGKEFTDTNMGKYWDLLLHYDTGNPVRGAYQTRSLSFTGLGGRREENLVLALTEIHKELTLYPDNYPARHLLYTILLRQNENEEVTRYAIKKEIDSILSNNLQSEEVMRFALGGYRMIGETEEAEKVEDILIKLNPRSDQAAMKAFGEIIQLEDNQLRMPRLQQFMLDFPDTRFAEYAMTNIATTAIAMDDSIQMVAIGDKMLNQSTTLAAASGLSGIAGALVEKQCELDRAIAYSNKALLLIRSTGASIRPPEVSPRDWEDRIQKTEARYWDILGWAMIRQGRLIEGIAELKEALEISSQPSLHFHLAQALERRGLLDEAMVHYAKTYAFGGEMGKNANQTLDSLWVQTNKNPNDKEFFIQEQLNQINTLYSQKVLSKRKVRPAPDFELEDLHSGWVRLSDQKGSVVVLCFWASWSQSSQRLFRSLKQISQLYGQDVLLLTIAVDVEMSTVNDFVKKHRIGFPVLLNDETDKAYSLQGVPMIFVIDETGNIHFEHRGYRPDLNEILVIELEDILKR
jgi:tetratricopeptide (TPR) repeat protein